MLLAALAVTVQLLFVSAAPLWPLPTDYSLGNKTVWLSDDLSFAVNLSNSIQTSYPRNITLTISTSDVVDKAVERALYFLQNDQFVPWKFHPRNSDFEPKYLENATVLLKQISLTQVGIDPPNVLKAKAGEVDESYNLTISLDGKTVLLANSTLGLLHGLTTLTQLFYTHTNGQVYTPYAPIRIADSPKFPHRGLNLDIARSWYEPDDIKRVLDTLSWNKMNRLHLHATDAQSWPLEIPSLPALSEKGAYRRGLSYSPPVLASIHEYAAYRGISVIIETDMPGHTASIAHSYPELITAFNIQPNWADYSAEPPTGQLKLNNTAVAAFLTTLWSDLLPRLSPYTSYFHTGGDEVNPNTYNLQPDLRTNDTKKLKPLLQAFLDFNHAAVRRAGLTPMIWEEQLLTWNLTLPPDVIIQTWGSVPNATQQATALGHPVITSDYNSWYLDCGRGAWVDSRPGSETAVKWPYTDYCSPYKNWKTVYAFDPLEGVGKNATHLVFGGEVSLWSEQMDGVELDGALWPRAAAAAEVLWSGSKGPDGGNRSQVEASPRLGEWRERMVRRGIRAGVVQMAFCTIEGGACTT